MADGSPTLVLLDIRQIAEAFGITKRGACKRADKEVWSFTEEAGRRRLYNLAQLPTDVQQAIARHQAIQAASTVEKKPDYQAGNLVSRKQKIVEAINQNVMQRVLETGAKNAVGLTGTKKERMDARLDVLARLDAFAGQRRMGICNAMQDFCKAYGSGDLQVPVAVRNFVGPDLCPMTLRRWRKTLKTGGAAALAGEYGNRTGSGLIENNEALRDYIIGFIVNTPHASAVVLEHAVRMRFGEATPKYRTLARYLDKWKLDNAQLFISVTDPDKWKNKYKLALGSVSENIIRVNQRWEVDSTPADILTTDGRYNILGCIDVATRKSKLLVSKTSTGEAVSQLLRLCILDWGVPEEIKMDNGKDYASDRVQRSLLALQIHANFSAPFSPWEKPHIERFFRSFSHNLLEVLPGFLGHNVAEAQTLRASKSFAERMYKKNAVIENLLTPAQLQIFCDRWTNEYYYHKPHSELGGLSPYEREAALGSTIRLIADLRALDILLAAVPDNNGVRTVNKKGVKVDNRWYIHAEFALIVGQSVQCLYHQDMGKLVIYHDEAFFCVAECPEITGLCRRETAIEGTLIQNKMVKESRAAIRKLGGKAAAKRIAAEIIERHIESQYAPIDAPNIAYITPALAAASDAADALDATPKHVPRECTIADLDGVIDNRLRENALDETSEQRFLRALDYMLVPEDERNDIQRRFLKSHGTSSEFLGRWDLFEDFGPERMGLDTKYAPLMPEGTFYHRYIELKLQGEN